MQNTVGVGRWWRWTTCAMVSAVVLSGCTDGSDPAAPHGRANASGDLSAHETRLPDGVLEIVPRSPSAELLRKVQRYDEHVDGLTATTFASGGTSLTVLATPDGRPQASLEVSAGSVPRYKLNGVEHGELPPGAVPGPLATRGRFLAQLRRERGKRAPGRSLSIGSTNCLTCVIEPPIDTGSANTDFTGWYTGYIANIDTPYEYTTLRGTNGCTYSPDGYWKGCCDMHDFGYGDGGTTDADRKNSDSMLWDCMMRVGAGLDRANLYYTAVRQFGGGAFNWRDSYFGCWGVGASGTPVYGPGRYANNPWGLAYRLGEYRFSDECRAKGYT